MSQTTDGRMVKCDGDGCEARAFLPVALRPVLGQPAPENGPTADRWLFVRHQNRWRHYCPLCGARHLCDLSAGEAAVSRGG